MVSKYAKQCKERGEAERGKQGDVAVPSESAQMS